jgi:hypothetical protein
MAEKSSWKVLGSTTAVPPKLFELHADGPLAQRTHRRKINGVEMRAGADPESDRKFRGIGDWSTVSCDSSNFD